MVICIHIPCNINTRSKGQVFLYSVVVLGRHIYREEHRRKGQNVGVSHLMQESPTSCRSLLPHAGDLTGLR